MNNIGEMGIDFPILDVVLTKCMLVNRILMEFYQSHNSRQVKTD